VTGLAAERVTKFGGSLAYDIYVNLSSLCMIWERS